MHIFLTSIIEKSNCLFVKMENNLNHVNGCEENLDDFGDTFGEMNIDDDFYDDLPESVIIANLPEIVFTDENIKEEFESVFRDYEDSASFVYLKSFRRARINFSHAEYAVRAKLNLHESNFYGNCVKCFLAQPRDKERENMDPHLQPPLPDKQFLISPPASPPVGWEQVIESEPVVNYDLIAAMASLAPGQAHELHPQSESQPGIIVHICEEPAEIYGQKSLKIPQTKCPERRT